MTPSNDLFDLIKRLTPLEKKVLKITFSKKQERDNAYILLYNAIEKQCRSAKDGVEYNEEAIKKQLNEAIDTRSFSGVKNYLFHIILDTLRSNYSNCFSDFSVQQLIEKAKILYEKGLNDQAYKLIQKAKQEALESDFFPEVLQALVVERKIIKRFPIANYSKLTESVFTAEVDAIEKQLNLSNYLQLNSKLHVMFQTTVTFRNKQELFFFEEILQDPLLQNESTALSFMAKWIYYGIKNICNSSLGKFEKAHQYAEKRVNLFQTNPMTTDRIEKYLISLHQVAKSQIFLGKYKDAIQNFQKIKNTGKIYPKFIKNIPPEFHFKYLVITETDLHLRIADYAAGIAQLLDVEESLKKFGHTLPKDLQNILYYNIALLYFGTGEYHKALHWVNRILTENKNDYVLDLIAGAQIFSLIIHLELGNDNLLQYAAKSTLRYLTKRNRKYKVETLFLELLQIILDPDHKKEVPFIYPKMLKQFKKLSIDTFEKGAFEYVDFISWVESKIEHRPFAEIAKEKVKLG